MPIAKRPPDEVEKAFLDTLVGPLHAGLRIVVEGGKVYTIKLARLAEGSVGDARLIGWQCLTRKKNVAVGGDIATPLTGRASIVRGAVIDAAMKTLSSISTDERYKSDNYELRVLRLPALAIEAFWLHSIAHKTDHVVLHTSQHPDLIVDKPYSMDEFLGIVKPLAEVVMRQRRFPL